MPDQTTDHLSEAQAAVEAVLIGDNPPGTKAWHDTTRNEIRVMLSVAAPLLATYYEDKGAEKLKSVEAELKLTDEARAQAFEGEETMHDRALVAEKKLAAAEDKGRSEERERLLGDKAIEAAAGAQWELSDPDADHEVAPKKDHAGGWEQAGNGARFLYRGNARCVLLASLDSDQEGDDA